MSTISRRQKPAVAMAEPAWSWYPDSPPAVRSLGDPRIAPRIAGSWLADGDRLTAELVHTAWRLRPLEVASFRLAAIVSRPPVRSFHFAPPVSLVTPQVGGNAASLGSPAAGPELGWPGGQHEVTGPGIPGAAPQPPTQTSLPVSSGPSRATRIEPPDDIVKLGDRLYYVLQPSLESLLGGVLALPLNPFPYQLDGVAFLYPRYAAVLADEMGLGKTMQAITAVRLLLHAGELRRVLLVCPKPLVTNWQREFARWAPEIPLATLEGDPLRRAWLWQLPEAVVTVANYELVQRDREVVADPRVAYDLVVLDEAQRIKNRGGATAEAVRGIRRRRSWALTGTPVENSAEDLVGIFEFVAPGHLAPGMKPRRMARAVRDYVLRRTKDQVLDDLPPKLVRDAELPLTAEQRETYRRAEDEGVVRLSALGDAITVQHVFELVLRLKQICNFDPATGESAKLDRLVADLEEVAQSGQKAILFSQWVQTLTWLSRRLARFHPLEYHGQVSPRGREAVIEQFRDDRQSHVLLMSYGAGGVGLNLQFAGYVFLFDRWWNPAVEDQAISRAHRIGAAGPVTVTRFLSVGTIEERIDQILQQKREVFDTIFHDGEAAPRNLGLTQAEIFGLFDLRTPKGRLNSAA